MSLKIVAGNIEKMLGSMVPDELPSTVDSGEPKVAYHELVNEAEQESGVWSMSVGGFTIDGYSINEVMVMLSGRLRLTDSEGDVTEVVKGDMFYIPKGWSGRWDVLEDMQKAYVILH